MNILFLCVANSARSQMAEALAKSMLGKKHNIQSAGSMPSGLIHPNAVIAMQEIDINIHDQYSKDINELEKDFLENLDYVVTLCAEEVCPVVITKAKKLYWINEDPARDYKNPSQAHNEFAKVRNSLFNQLKEFMIKIEI